MTDPERPIRDRHGGKSEKDLQLSIDKTRRKESEKVEQDERFEENLVRQRALRLAHAEAERLASLKVGAVSGIDGDPPRSKRTKHGNR